MTQQEIEEIYKGSSLDLKDIVLKTEIESRLKYIDNPSAKKIAKFLLDYCFNDHEEVYTNNTVLVPMFRVLDALSMIGQKEISYSEC